MNVSESLNALADIGTRAVDRLSRTSSDTPTSSVLTARRVTVVAGLTILVTFSHAVALSLLPPAVIRFPFAPVISFLCMGMASVVALSMNYFGLTRASAWTYAVGMSLSLVIGAAQSDGSLAWSMLYYLAVPLLLGSSTMLVTDSIVNGLFNVLLTLLFPFLHEEVALLDMLLGPTFFLVGAIVAAAFVEQTGNRLRTSQVEKLAKQESRYRELLLTSFDGLMYHRDGIIIHVQAPVADIFELEPGELVGRHVVEFARADQRAALGANLYGFDELTEFEVVLLNGKQRYVETIGSPAEFEGQPARLIAMRDITERRQREQLQSFSQSFAAGLRRAQTRADLPIVALEQLQQMLPAEASALLTWDIAEERIVIEQIRHAANIADPMQWLAIDLCQRVMETATPSWLLPAGEQPAGHSATAHILVVPLAAESGVIGCLWVLTTHGALEAQQRNMLALEKMLGNALERAGQHAATQDYAERLEARVAERTRELRTANERLLELDQLKSKFIADISHELRTPVTNIMLYAQLITQGAESKRDYYIEVVHLQAMRLATLLQDIFKLSRIDDENKLPFTKVSVEELVSHAQHQWQAEAEHKNLTLNVHVAPHLPPILGIVDHLEQVMSQLVANSVRYTTSGSVTISAEYDADANQILLRVDDTGVGFATEDIPHVFDRFYRGRAVGETTQSGTGLGLALVNDVVERHGGSVTVATKETPGARIEVRFPAQTWPSPS